MILRLRSVVASALPALRVRPRFAAAMTLLLVPAVMTLTFSSASEPWEASPQWSGSELVPARAALLFEGDLRSGEGSDLVAALARQVDVQVSWLSTRVPDGLVLSDGPPRSRQGRMVVGLPPGGYAELSALAAEAALPFPSLTFVSAQPWSYEPSPQVLPLQRFRTLPLAPSLLLLAVAFFPVLESYSRLRHVLRALYLASTTLVGSAVGVLSALLAVGWLTSYGSGHDLATLLYASYATALVAASLPPFWASRLDAEGVVRPEESGSASALSLVLPAAVTLTLTGAMVALLPSAPVFGAAGSVLVASGVASGVGAAVSASVLVLAGFRPAGAVRAHSALMVTLLAVAPLLSRALSRRAFAAVAAALAVVSASWYVPEAPQPALRPAASVLFEVSSLLDPAPEARAAADVVARAVESSVLLRAYELFSPTEGPALFLGEMLPYASSPDRDLPPLASAPTAVRAVGGSYLDWVSWRSAFPVALAAAAAAAAAALVAAAARFYHARFYMARASLLLVAASLVLVPLLLHDTSGVLSARPLGLMMPWLMWVAVFGAEVARELDSGADGASASSAAASVALPLLLAPGGVLLLTAPSLFLPLSGLSVALILTVLVAAALVGPRESLRV